MAKDLIPIAPDLTGASIGDFRLLSKIGRSQSSTVYRAVSTDGSALEVALKVLNFEPSNQPGFRDRFNADLAHLRGTHHPHILPVYDYGIFHDMAYVAYALATGGSLADLLKLGSLDLETSRTIIIALAEALQWAHEYGLVHRDIKPSNVLFDANGVPLLADFGLAPTHFGFAIGTPGYMSPEQAKGEASDQRSDVYSLATVVFEMLAGAALHQEESNAELLRVTTMETPAISERAPELPRPLNTVLQQALSSNPSLRPSTPLEFLSELEQVLNPPSETATFAQETFSSEERHQQDLEAEFERQRAHALRLIDSALCAGIAIDEMGYVVSWNQAAETTFGWSKEEIVGRSLSSTLIPARYREGHERGLRRYLETGKGQMMGQIVELSALDRLGREFPIQLSLAPAIQSGKRMVVFGFARDISSEKRIERLRKAESEALQALEEGESLGAVVSRMLEAIAIGLGCRVGALWQPQGPEVLRCVALWYAPEVDCSEFLAATRAARLGRGQGLPGRAFAIGEPVWASNLLHEGEEPRALAALRGGLRSAVAIPITTRSSQASWALEFFSSDLQRSDEDLLLRLAELGRQIGRRVG